MAKPLIMFESSLLQNEFYDELILSKPDGEYAILMGGDFTISKWDRFIEWNSTSEKYQLNAAGVAYFWERFQNVNEHSVMQPARYGPPFVYFWLTVDSDDEDWALFLLEI